MHPVGHGSEGRDNDDLIGIMMMVVLIVGEEEGENVVVVGEMVVGLEVVGAAEGVWEGVSVVVEVGETEGVVVEVVGERVG